MQKICDLESQNKAQEKEIIKYRSKVKVKKSIKSYPAESLETIASCDPLTWRVIHVTICNKNVHLGLGEQL